MAEFTKEQLEQIMQIYHKLSSEKSPPPRQTPPQHHEYTPLTSFISNRPMRPQHQSGYHNNRRPQTSYHTQNYSPQTSHHTQNYPPHFSPSYHRNPLNMIQIKLMITFVESATIFWAQVLSPDLIDISRKLEESLASICPKLLPATKISKTAIYACQWSDNMWYRCISCGPIDPEGNVEMLFVDYGNREKRNISQLVWINSQNILSIPFNACPFRFPNLIANTDKETEAIKCFNTVDVLTGVVTRHPKADDYTDIMLCRPLGEENDTECHTYNNLMIEKKFALQNDNSPANKPPPTAYFLRHLQSRIQQQNIMLREKQAELDQMYAMHSDGAGMSPVSRDSSFSSPAKKHSPLLSKLSLDNKSVTETPEEAKQAPKNTPTSSHQTQTNVPDNLSSDGKLQQLLDDLFSDIERYYTGLEMGYGADDLLAIMECYNKLHRCSVGEELVVKKLQVEEADQNLHAAQCSIKSCSDRKLLEEHIRYRDVALQTIIEKIDDYKTCLADCKLEETARAITEVLETLSEEEGACLNSCISSYTTPEEALQCITEHDKDSATLLQEHQNKCTASLATLSSKFKSCVRSTANVAANESPDKTSDMISVIRSTRTQLKDFDELTISANNTRRPIVASFRSLIYSKAKQDLLNIDPYIRSREELDVVFRKAVAALQNKPDMRELNKVKGLLKKAKKDVKYAQIEAEEDSDNEDGNCQEKVRECMYKLHKLYRQEEEELGKLADYALTTHPELLVEHPQLKNLMEDDSLVKCTWDIAEFVVPNSTASINSKKQNVFIGFYGDIDPVYLVEYKLQSVDGSLEEEAVNLIKDNLEGCFAIFIDKKRLVAYGATEILPE